MVCLRRRARRDWERERGSGGAGVGEVGWGLVWGFGGEEGEEDIVGLRVGFRGGGMRWEGEGLLGVG